MKHSNQTITVFNKRYDANLGYDTYLRTVIHGVSWKGSMISTATTGGLVSANQFTIRIPVSAPKKSFVSVKAFQTIIDASDFFTLSVGDIIVHGEVMEDYTSPSDIKCAHEEVVTVLAIADNRNGKEPHFKVVAV